jgi:hypothetical protein
MAPSTHGPPLYFWGIRRDCKRDALLSAVVEKRLAQLGSETRRVWPVPALENAKPALAAQEFARSCEIKDGILVGGSVEERSMGRDTPITLMRMWRVDLATHTLRFRDHYCRACEVSRMLATQLAYFAEEGSGSSDSSDSRVPSFCFDAAIPSDRSPASSGDPVTPRASPQHGDRMLLSLRVGEDKSAAERKLRTLLVDALRLPLGLTGRDIQLAELDRTTGLPQGSQPALLRGQVRLAVHVEVSTASKKASSRAVTLRVAQPGEGTQATVFECVDCGDAALSTRLQQAIPRFVDEVTKASPSVQSLPLPPEIQGVLCSSRANSGPWCPGSDGKNLDSSPNLYPFAGALCGESVDVPLDPSEK